MIKHSAPPIRGFIAFPFIALANIFAFIASCILPMSVLVVDMNECVMFEDGEDLEDLFNDEED